MPSVCSAERKEDAGCLNSSSAHGATILAVTAWKNCSAPSGAAGFRCTQLAYTKAVEGVKSYADVTPELVAATNAAVQKSGVSIAVDGTYVELSYADEDKRRAEVAKA